MPRNYGGLMYAAGAGQGRTVGQGLAGLGQIVSGGIKEGERKKEKKEEKQLEKTLATINITMKMAGQIADPKTKMDYLTGYAMPMILKSGIVPEGMDKEQLKEGLAFIATQTKEQIKGYTEDNDFVLKLMREGKNKEALKKIASMRQEYKHISGMEGFLSSIENIAKEEIKDTKGLEKEGRAATKEAKGLLAKGTSVKAKKGEKGAVKMGGLWLKPAPSGAGDDSKTKHKVEGFANRTFTFKEMASEMKDLASNLKEQTKDNIFLLDPNTMDEGEKDTLIEKVKGYAETGSKEVKALAKKYMALGKARGWFEEEAIKPKAGGKKKETPKDFISRILQGGAGGSF